jgi:hypothetical protein
MNSASGFIYMLVVILMFAVAGANKQRFPSQRLQQHRDSYTVCTLFWTYERRVKLKTIEYPNKH